MSTLGLHPYSLQREQRRKTRYAEEIKRWAELEISSSVTWCTRGNMIPLQSSIQQWQKTSTKPLPLVGARGPCPTPWLPAGWLIWSGLAQWPFANTLDVDIWHFTNLFFGVWVLVKQHVKKEMKVFLCLLKTKENKAKEENKSKENKVLPRLERAGLRKNILRISQLIKPLVNY